MKTTLLDLFTSKKFLAALSAVAIYVAGRFGFDLDPAALDRIFAAFLVYVGAQGAADFGKSAALIHTQAANDNAPAPSPAATSARFPAVLVLMIACFGLATTQLACSSWRARTANGVGAFLDCEAPHVDPNLLAEAKTVAIAAVQKWISGDGHTDTAGLKSAAAPLKSDLMRCAFDGAIAALATPTPPAQKPGEAVRVAAFEVDGGELRAKAALVREELGWPAQAVSR
jgi:hypothetical protein